MTVTVGINGFGRIGRCTLAHIAESARNDVQVVKINATGPLETSAHLLRYDSVHGRFPGEVKVSGDTMDLGRGPMQMFSTYNPEELDWSGCDVVLECTGNFNDGKKSAIHLERGAKKVLISAPASNVQRTVVYGVNHRSLTAEDNMVSNGSCTTNCLAPLAKVLVSAAVFRLERSKTPFTDSLGITTLTGTCVPSRAVIVSRSVLYWVAS